MVILLSTIMLDQQTMQLIKDVNIVIWWRGISSWRGEVRKWRIHCFSLSLFLFLLQTLDSSHFPPFDWPCLLESTCSSTWFILTHKNPITKIDIIIARKTSVYQWLREISNYPRSPPLTLRTTQISPSPYRDIQRKCESNNLIPIHHFKPIWLKYFPPIDTKQRDFRTMKIRHQGDQNS